jgi:glycogen operon protein
MTLLVSLGVPMISGGDELGRSQSGNNNAYCHDSPLTWTPWSSDVADEAFLAFARTVIEFRAAQPALRRETFFRGAHGGASDVRWLNADGSEVRDEDWEDDSTRVLGVLLEGDAIGELDAHGKPILGDTVLLLFNAHEDGLEFALPDRAGATWEVVLDTASPNQPGRSLPSGHPYILAGRSVAALKIPPPREDTSG